VTAINRIGPSLPSVINSQGAVVETVPHKPPVAPTKNYKTTQGSLVIDYMFLEGTADGGSAVLSYEIQWDQGETVNTFVTLQNNLLSQVTVNSGIVGGRVYGFRYRARNRQGWSAYSDIRYFKAANVPD